MRLQAFGARQRRDRRRQRGQRLAASAPAPRSPSRNPSRTGRRARGPRRWWAARDSGRTHNRRRLPGLYGPTKTLPAWRILGSSDVVGNAEVLGREAIGELDGLVERAHQRRWREFFAIDLARDRARSAASPAAAPPRCATAAASRFDVVSRIAEASTSCSACASMSAARWRGSPSAAMIRISVGPATKSMPTSPASSFLAAAT